MVADGIVEMLADRSVLSDGSVTYGTIVIGQLTFRDVVFTTELDQVIDRGTFISVALRSDSGTNWTAYAVRADGVRAVKRSIPSLFKRLITKQTSNLFIVFGAAFIGIDSVQPGLNPMYLTALSALICLSYILFNLIKDVSFTNKIDSKATL